MRRRALELAEIIEKQFVILSGQGVMRVAAAVSNDAQQLRLLALLGSRFFSGSHDVPSFVVT